MANVILKFRRNPKNKGEIISFYKKKVCMILNGSEARPKPNEYWECFLWADRGKFVLVKPFKKINPKDIDNEFKRVETFNGEVKALEKMIGDDFAKLVFDPDDNTPWLLAKKSAPEIMKKYSDHEFKVVKEDLWVRPKVIKIERKEKKFDKRKK